MKKNALRLSKSYLILIVLFLLMSSLISAEVTSVPHTRIEIVTDTLHGVIVEDPYRWLEDGSSPEVKEWTEQQNKYYQSYIDTYSGKRKNCKKNIRPAFSWFNIGSLNKR